MVRIVPGLHKSATYVTLTFLSQVNAPIQSLTLYTECSALKQCLAAKRRQQAHYLKWIFIYIFTDLTFFSYSFVLFLLDSRIEIILTNVYHLNYNSR